MIKTFTHPKFTATFTDNGGHFSFTGQIDGGCGACGAKIAELAPELAPLNAVHLCNSETGEPMHAFTNAFHHLSQGHRDKAQSVLGIPDELFDKWVGLKRTPAHRPSDAEVIGAITEFWQERADEARELAEELPPNMCGTFVDPVTNLGHYAPILDTFTDSDRAIAVAMLEDIDVEEVEECRYGDNIYSACGKEYRVLTDEEADEAQKESFDAYIDDCLLPEMGEVSQYMHFDREQFYHDAEQDGRGHTLNHYDGEEHNENGYYLYQH